MLQTFKDWARANIPKLILYTIGIIAVLYAMRMISDLIGEKDRLHTELIGQKEAYVQLSEHAAKLEIQYKSQEDLKAELEKNWKAEKEALQGRVKILSNATFLIREQARRENRSDLVYEGTDVKYLFNEIRFKDGPPVGYVLIFDDGRVTSKLYNHQISVNTAVSRDESSGRYDIISKADFILKSPHLSKDTKNWMNEPFPLKITGGKALIDPTEPVQLEKRFHLWSPTLNGGFNVGSDLKAAVGVSLMGYGYSKRDLDWKFLQLGVDYSKTNEYGVHLIPVMYRPFPNYLKNTYLGAGVGLDDRGYNPFLSLSVGF